VKGGAALEAIGAARTVAFDKKGTLTEGRPRVTDVVPTRDGIEEGRVLAYQPVDEIGLA
jgi:Cd2+/Zn2+-exporting ATPase